MKKLIALTALISFPFFLRAFSPSSEEIDRDLKLLGVYFLQLINLPIFGLGAFVFSLLGMILTKRKLKIIGLVFLSVFTIVTLLGAWIITNEKNAPGFLNKLIWIEFVVILVCSVLLVLKRTVDKNVNPSTNTHSSSYNPAQEEEDEFPYFK